MTAKTIKARVGKVTMLAMDRDRAMNLIESGVKDIKIGIRAYSRSGN